MTNGDRAAMANRLRVLVKDVLDASDRDADVDIDETAFLPAVLDSIGLAALITMIEDEWRIEIADEEIEIDQLESVGTLTDWIVQKLGSP